MRNEESMMSTVAEESSVNVGYYVRWFLGVACLAVLGICSGTINMFPSLISEFVKTTNMSHGLAVFMLTGGTVLMYLTLPAGIYMDHFGPANLLFLSITICLVSGIFLLHLYTIPVLFVIFYLLFAFGSSSLFIAVLEIVLSYSPASIKGVSTSIVSASLSFAFGFWFLIYNIGTDLKTGMEYVIYIAVGCMVVFYIVGTIILEPYAPERVQSTNETSHWDVLKDWLLYALLIGMLMTVFEGLFVLSGGAFVWKAFDPDYSTATSDWSMAFSLMNCIFTISLSSLLDFLCSKYSLKRQKGYAVIILLLSAIPIILSFVERLSKSHTLMGIFMSAMGISFGFGLTQIPTLTSDNFGFEKYGFAFGIIQIGSIISSMTAMPIMQLLGRLGFQIILLGLGALQICLALVFFFFTKGEEKYEVLE